MQAMLETDGAPDATASELAWRGIELCRRGDWQEGFYWLSLVADRTVETSAVPPLFFAYLGYGLAHFQGELDAGLDLCRRAVDLDVYQPESYLLLARTLLRSSDRRSALAVIEQGLQIDATFVDLRALRRELGDRRPPMLAFLPRGHLVNRTLGKLRHHVFGPVRPFRPRNGVFPP